MTSPLERATLRRRHRRRLAAAALRAGHLCPVVPRTAPQGPVAALRPHPAPRLAPQSPPHPDPAPAA